MSVDLDLDTHSKPSRTQLFTLCGGLSVSACQGDNTLVHFDANYHVPLLKVLGEKFAIIGLLVEGLVEENDSADAGLDAVVCGKEQLTVQPPVLLGVLGIDALESLCYATCRISAVRQYDARKVQVSEVDFYNISPMMYL